MKKIKLLLLILLISINSIGKNNTSKDYTSTTLPPEVLEKNLTDNFTIEILNLTTNGLILPNNTINFNGVNELEIEFDMKVTFQGQYNSNYVNNIRLAGSLFNPNNFNNETNPNYNNGVISYNLFSYEHNLENLGNIYTKTIHKKLKFQKHSITSTGYTISFAYSSWSLGQTFKKLVYKLDGGSKISNNNSVSPSGIVNFNSITYSEGLPVVNEKVLIPENLDNFYNENINGTRYGIRKVDINFSYNFNHGSNLTIGYYPIVIVSLRKYDTHIEKVLTSDYLYGFNGNITLKDIELDYSDMINLGTAKIEIRVIFQGIEFFKKSILVSTSPSIKNNYISDHKFIPINQTISFPNQNTATYTTGTRATGSSIINITNYMWQYKLLNSDLWLNFINGNSKNLTSTFPIGQDMQVRRIATSIDGNYSISNPLSISVNTPTISNSICCNQTINNGAIPSNIIGNILTNPSYTYKWEKRLNTGTGLTSQNIWREETASYGSKDYFFNSALQNRGSTSIIQYRRLIMENDIIKSISNISSLTINNSNRTSIPDSYKLKDDVNQIDKINIFPNPVEDFLNINFGNNLYETSDIHLTDLEGNKIKTFKAEGINDLNIDLSFLKAGIYIININFNNKIISHKIIKK